MTVGVGIIGMGYWGPNLARNVLAHPATHLSAICDADGERLAQVAERHPSAKLFTNPDELIAHPEVEAVAVATPVATHFELARRCLEAGRHVLVEKPLTASSAEGEELIAIAAAHDRALMVDHVFLFSPAVQTLARLVHGGEVGKMLFVDSVRINLGLFQHDVNVIWDLAPHDLSIIDRLVGRAPLGIVAAGAGHPSQGLVNVAHLHLDFGDDLLASVHVNWLSPVKLRHFLVGGSRRSVLYNDLDVSEPVKVYDRGVDFDPDPEGRRDVLVSYRSGDVLSPRIEKVEPLFNAVGHFAECIASGTPPLSDGAQGVRLVRLLEAADASLDKGGAYVELARG